MTKFGIDQTSSPAPLWWRRLERAYIIIFAPALAGLMATIIESEKKQVIVLAVITFSSAMIKGVGIFYGSGESYPDAPNAEPKP